LSAKFKLLRSFFPMLLSAHFNSMAMLGFNF
jgi:hypothetical protein